MLFEKFRKQKQQFLSKIMFFRGFSKRDVCDSHKMKKTKNEKHGQN